MRRNLIATSLKLFGIMRIVIAIIIGSELRNLLPPGIINSNFEWVIPVTTLSYGLLTGMLYIGIGEIIDQIHKLNFNFDQIEKNK